MHQIARSFIKQIIQGKKEEVGRTENAQKMSMDDANPSTIAIGQSSVLSWVVLNASSTSLDNGIGAATSMSITVTPIVTTTYLLSATNPNGAATKSVTVTVIATSMGVVNDIQTQIQNLLNQIANLRAQIKLLVQQATGGTTGGTMPPASATSTPSCNFNRDLSFWG